MVKFMVVLLQQKIGEKKNKCLLYKEATWMNLTNLFSKWSKTSGTYALKFQLYNEQIRQLKLLYLRIFVSVIK